MTFREWFATLRPARPDDEALLLECWRAAIEAAAERCDEVQRNAPQCSWAVRALKAHATPFKPGPMMEAPRYE